MTPPFAGIYFCNTFMECRELSTFIKTVQNNGAFYMYSEEQLKDIWEALETLYNRARA